jgi:hypothetical protein
MWAQVEQPALFWPGQNLVQLYPSTKVLTLHKQNFLQAFEFVWLFLVDRVIHRHPSTTTK